ncbi:predicted protein, partial [Nematostella vectensis]
SYSLELWNTSLPLRYIDAQLNGDISGIRIGLLREGFGHQNSEEDVDRIVKEASIRLAERTGHEVVGISVPMHLQDLLGKYGGHNINTCPFDLTGHPALSINAGLSDGLPVGLMIVGKKYDEETILRVAYAFESIRDKTLPQ